MIAEAKQKYRGVLCKRCGQPIPLSPSAELKERELQEHRLDEFALRSVTLRCWACHGESLCTHSDVIDLDGTPKKRSSQAHKNPGKQSRSIHFDLPDLTKPTPEP
jgi:hypothetical protein